MNVKTACKLLNITTSHHLLTLACLKKKYYTQCLRAHPDKNGNSTESNAQFQKINDAYSFLQTTIQMQANLKNVKPTKSKIHFSSFQIFRKSVGDFIQKTNLIYRDIDHTVIASIIKSIVDETYMDNYFSLIGSLNKSTREKIVSFIDLYKNRLNISSDTLELVRLILLYDDDDDDSETGLNNSGSIDQIVYLNPTLNDLFCNNIFKFVTQNQLFYVPLWFGESIFDLECGKSMQVICNPILPNGVTIDDDNNLYTSIHICLPELNKLIKNNCCLYVFIDSIKICVSTVDLSYIQLQFIDNLDPTFIYTHCDKEKGPSRANPDDMYNVLSRSDIFVYIYVEN